MTAEVRKTCTELKEKIAGPATIDRVLKTKKGETRAVLTWRVPQADIAQIERARLQRSAAHEGAQDRGRDYGEDAVQGMAISCTAVSRLIRALDTRKTRARLDRLVRDGKIERKREQGTHGPVYLFRRLS